MPLADNQSGIPSLSEEEPSPSLISERELLELHSNPEELRATLGDESWNALRESDPDFIDKLIVSSYLSRTKSLDANEISNNYEAYAKSIGLTGLPANDANDIIFDIRSSIESSTKDRTAQTISEGLSGASNRGKGNIAQAYSLIGVTDPTYQGLINDTITNIKSDEKLLESDSIPAGNKDFVRFRVEESKKFIASTVLLQSAEIKNFIEAQAKVEGSILLDGYKDFIESGKIPTSAEGFSQFLISFMTEQTVQNAPTAIKTLTAGPLTPAVVFGDTLNSERAFEMIEHLREAGVDFSNEESLRTALQDRDLMQDAMSRGVRKAFPIALTAMLSAFLPIRGKTLIRKAGTEILSQGTLDAVGETIGQLFATGDVDFQDVLLEVLGGTTQTVAETAAKISANIAKSPVMGILKNEDGSLKSRKEVVAMGESLTSEVRGEMQAVDGVASKFVEAAADGSENAYTALSEIIRKNETIIQPEEPNTNAEFSAAFKELEAATSELETNLDVEEAQNVGHPLRPGDKRDKPLEQALQEKQDREAQKIRSEIQEELAAINDKIELQAEEDAKGEPQEFKESKLTQREIRSVSKLLDHLSGQGKKLKGKELAVIREKIRGDKRLAKFASRKLKELDAKLFAKDEKIANLKEAQEQAIRKLKDSFKARISKIRSDYQARVKKLKEEVRELKIENKQKWIDERADVREMADQLQELLKAMPPELRGKVTFLKKMANATTVDGRLKVLEDVADRVNDLLEQNFRAKRLSFLKKLIKRATKGNAKAVSQRLGDRDSFVLKIKEIMSRSEDENREALNNETFTSEEEEQSISTLYAVFGGIKNGNSKDINIAITLAQAIIEDGKDFRKKFKERAARHAQKIATDLLREMNVVAPGDKSLMAPGERQPDPLLQPEQVKQKKEARNAFLAWMRDGIDVFLTKHDGIEQLIENLIRVPGKQYTGKSHETFTDAAFDATQDFLTRQNAARMQAFDAFVNALRKTGLSAEEVKDLFVNLTKSPNPDKGEFSGVYFRADERYPVVNQPISKDVGIQLWMWRQDKTQNPSFETMGWTADTDAQLAAYIGAEGMALGRYMLDTYKGLGLEMNDVLFKNEGWKLPLVENYSPAFKVSGNKVLEMMDSIGKDGIVRHLEKNNSQKLREKNKAPLNTEVGAIEIFDRHLTEMNHYITHAEVARDLRNTFKNNDVQLAISQVFGKKRIPIIMHMVDNFSRGSIDYGKMDSLVSKLISNVAVGKLSFNFPSALKQLGSIPAYAREMSAKEWTAGFAGFFFGINDKIKILLETDYMKNRLRSTGDRDLRNIAESKSFQQAAIGVKNWRDRMMILTRLGDAGAIMAGGWPVYDKAFKEAKGSGLSDVQAHKKAERAFGIASERAQQSAFQQNLSYWQSSGSFAKLFTMFLTAPIQYLRITVSAMRAANSGRITRAEAAKTLFIYHFLLPQIFTAMASMGLGLFSDDEEKNEAFWRRQAWAAAVGNFNALFLFGDGIDAVLGSYIKDEQFFDMANPVMGELGDIVRDLSKLKGGNLDTLEEQGDLIGGMLLLFAGIPYDTLDREIRSKMELIQGEDVYKNLLGISDYAAFEHKAPKRKKRKRVFQ